MNEEPIYVAVVIPCYNVGETILELIPRIGPAVSRIIVVDDGCPQNTGRIVEQRCSDPRVVVLFHQINQGVGAAVVSGYQRALSDNAIITVKLDGDGQMDPADIPALIAPILNIECDYTKGNRLYDSRSFEGMPAVRLFGNAVLSFINKAASGYWDVMDPTNGFTAIHRSALEKLPLDRLDKGFFFESDMLFRLNVARAVVLDVPLPARYGDEVSNLRPFRILRQFPSKFVSRLVKRVFYNYFVRDFNIASLNMVLGSALFAFGSVYGGYHWYRSIDTGVAASSGTVMIAALPLVFGFQFLLSALNFDVANLPRKPLQRTSRPRPSRSDPRDYGSEARID